MRAVRILTLLVATICAFVSGAVARPGPSPGGAPWVRHTIDASSRGADGTRLAVSMSRRGTTIATAPATAPRAIFEVFTNVTTITVWNVADGRTLFNTELEQPSRLVGPAGYGLSWSPDGKRLLVVDGSWTPAGMVNSRFFIHNATTGKVETTVNVADRGGILAGPSPVFSPDGRRIAAALNTRRGRARPVPRRLGRARGSATPGPGQWWK